MYVSSINPGLAAAAEGRWSLFTEADLHQSLFHHYCLEFVPLGIYNPQLLLPCDFTKKHFFQEPHAHIAIHNMNTKQCVPCRWPGCRDARMPGCSPHGTPLTTERPLGGIPGPTDTGFKGPDSQKAAAKAHSDSGQHCMY